MRHKTALLVATGAFVGWLAPTSGAFAQEGAAQPSSDTAQPSAGRRMPGQATGQLITASAKVEKVDAGKRELVLKGEKGKPFTVQVPEKVSRLDNVRPGDTINVAFYESVAVSLQKPGTAAAGETRRSTTERAPGNLPGGAMGEQVTKTAKITNLDKEANEVTIQTPSGEKNTIQISDPQVQSQLKDLKVGDQIRATYTTAMATSVTPKKAM